MVERPLSMREVPGSIPGSIPGFSNPFPLFIFCFFFFLGGGNGGEGGGGVIADNYFKAVPATLKTSLQNLVFCRILIKRF